MESLDAAACVEHLSQHVRLAQEGRRLAVECEALAVEDPESVGWALAVLLQWNHEDAEPDSGEAPREETG